MNDTLIKISIIEDREVMFEHLQDLFNDQVDMECIAIYKNAEWALEKLPGHTVDIVFVDIGLPGINGIECVKQLKPLLPNAQFLMYTVFEQNDELFESLKAGANGYLLKNSSDDQILSAIRELYQGGSPMSPSIARKVTDFFFHRGSASRKLSVLSKREQEILGLLAKGFLYKEIAEKLTLTSGTIKQHIHRIYKKLHVNNRTEAINILTGLE